MCDQQSLRSACAYAQPDQSLCLSLEYSMIVKLLTEHHLEFLSLTGGCSGSAKSTHVKCHIVGNHMYWLICKVHVFLTYFSIHFSSGILVLVTFERTLCVISPHKVKLIFKRRNSLIWVAVLGIALFLIDGQTFYGYNILNIGEDGEMLLVCEPDGSPVYLDFIDDVWIWIWTHGIRNERHRSRSVPLISDPMCPNFYWQYTNSCTTRKTSPTA